MGKAGIMEKPVATYVDVPVVPGFSFRIFHIATLYQIRMMWIWLSKIHPERSFFHLPFVVYDAHGVPM